MNANPILSEVRRDDITHDPWGTAINWLFAVAENLTNQGMVVPSEWDYVPSILGVQLEGFAEEWIDDGINNGELTESDLLYAGNILSRFVDWADAAGRSY